MHTTLEPVGNPADQSAALAFQLVVPVVGPCQLSVQVAAALGWAVATSATPVAPIDARATVNAAAARLSPCNFAFGSIFDTVCPPTLVIAD